MSVASIIQPGQKIPPVVRKLVPPPRQGSAVQQPAQQHTGRQQHAAALKQPAAVSHHNAAANDRAVRAEMASMASEVQTKNKQLSKANAAVRQVAHVWPCYTGVQIQDNASSQRIL